MDTVSIWMSICKQDLFQALYIWWVLWGLPGPRSELRIVIHLSLFVFGSILIIPLRIYKSLSLYAQIKSSKK